MISIITITFNNYSELIETLESIKGLKNTESIVINGGSCEQTRNFLITYSGISLTESDKGISDAFNKGLKLAKGDAVMFLNSGDILIDHNYINTCNDFFAKNDLLHFSYSDIYFNDPHLGKILIKSEKKKINLATGMPYPHQSLIVRKSIFETIGNFDLHLKIAMDLDLVIRMFKHNFTNAYYYPHPTVLMDGNGISSNQQIKSVLEIKSILRKHGILNLKSKLRLSLSLFLAYIKKIKPFLILIKKCRNRVNK